MDTLVIDWLLEDNNPAIKYRTKTELLGQVANANEVKEWIFNKLPKDWNEAKGLWYIYYITAIAECGLTIKDIPSTERIEQYIHDMETNFEYGCADFMMLRALVKLGCHKNPIVLKIIENLQDNYLPDGGFLCQNRLKKFKYVPKSCYKANIHVLMFIAECKKQNIDISFGQPIVEYFLKRNIFYKSDDHTKIVLQDREGWSITDTFHPFESMRIGIHNVVETFSALGYGNADLLKEAWDFLYKYRDEEGKMILAQTLTKSYLPKEKIGKASKWVTFYTLLAEKERNTK